MTAFKPSKAFAAKCEQVSARTRQIDIEFDQAFADLKLANAALLDKLSRVEKITLLKELVAA